MNLRNPPAAAVAAPVIPALPARPDQRHQVAPVHLDPGCRSATPARDTPQPYGRPASGTVFGVSAATGAKVWSGTVGQATNGPVLSGIAIGGGLLVVPAGSTLTAFGN
jgi:hypothetical protein